MTKSIVLTTTGGTVTFNEQIASRSNLRQFITSAGPAAHRNKLGFDFRTMQPNNNGNKVTIRLNCPIPAVVAEGNSGGYLSIPKALGENKIIVNYDVSRFSSTEQALESYEELVALLSLPEVKSILVDQIMSI